MENQKQQLRAIKKQIKRSNWAVQGFMRAQGYSPGSYQRLHSTDIWARAKHQLLEYYRLKNLDLICFYCNSEISNNPTLHHKAYNWNKLFKPKNVTFLHDACHSKLHAERRGYKKGTWKKVGKGLLRMLRRFSRF